MHLLILGHGDSAASAALRARELDPAIDITVLAPPGPSTGPSPLSGVEATIRRDCRARHIDVAGRRVGVDRCDGGEWIPYDRLILATGSVPSPPPIHGLDPDHAAIRLLSAADGGVEGRHVAALTRGMRVGSAVVVGADHLGLRAATLLAERGTEVSVFDRGDHVLPLFDTELAAVVTDRLRRHDVGTRTSTWTSAVDLTGPRPRFRGASIESGEPFEHTADLAVIVSSPRPESRLARAAGARIHASGAVCTDRYLHTGLPAVWAAGSCSVTHHFLLGETYRPDPGVGHKQGAVAAENALGGSRPFSWSVGGWRLEVFGLGVGSAGMAGGEVIEDWHQPVTSTSLVDGETDGTMWVALTGDTVTGQLLGARFAGGAPGVSGTATDVAVTAIFNGNTVEELTDLDITGGLRPGRAASPLQVAARHWEHRVRSA